MDKNCTIPTKVLKKHKIVSVYFIIKGLADLTAPFLSWTCSYPEFEAKSLTYKIAGYCKQDIMAVIFIATAIGILLKKSWARKLGLVLIAINSIYFANNVAWAIAFNLGGGTPRPEIYGLGAAISLVWSGTFFYLLLSKKSQASSSDNKDGVDRMSFK